MRDGVPAPTALGTQGVNNQNGRRHADNELRWGRDRPWAQGIIGDGGGRKARQRQEAILRAGTGAVRRARRLHILSGIWSGGRRWESSTCAQCLLPVGLEPRCDTWASSLHRLPLGPWSVSLSLSPSLFFWLGPASIARKTLRWKIKLRMKNEEGM